MTYGNKETGEYEAVVGTLVGMTKDDVKITVYPSFLYGELIAVNLRVNENL